MSQSVNLETSSFKQWDELSPSQKACTLGGIACVAVSVLAMLILAITQSGALQSILGKYHIALVEKQVLAITVSTAVIGSSALLLGLPAIIVPHLKSNSPEIDRDVDPIDVPNQPVYQEQTYTAEEFKGLIAAGHQFPPGPICIVGDLKLNPERDANLKLPPNRLHVIGNLRIYHMESMSLPTELYVDKELSFDYCQAGSLPEKLYVGGELSFFYCELESLPKSLYVGGNLSLTNTPLEMVGPAYIERDLNLSSVSVKELSPGLYIGRSLQADRSPLRSLPEHMHVGGDLNLSRTRLTSLPSWIHTLGPLSNGQTRHVYLENTRLSAALVERLRQVDAPGMQFHISQAASRPKRSFKSLEEAFSSWKITIEEPIELNEGQLRPVLKFLGRLTTTAEYKDAQASKVLRQRVIDAFKLMAQNDTMKEDVVRIIASGLASCDDRIISAFDEIELMVRVQNVSDNEQELRQLGIGLLRLEMVHAKARQHIELLTWVDEIEVFLAFQIKLADQLDLPLSTRNMIFENIAQITDEQVQAAGVAVLKECTEERIEAFLNAWDPWKKHQRRLSVTPYATLPLIEATGREKEECPLFACIPAEPVLYKNRVYEYEAFIQTYIEQGVNPFTKEPIVWSDLKRLK